LDKLYSIHYLPPFRENGETEQFLKKLDVIWIPEFLSTPHYTHSTQDYLRYKLHLSPFLKNAVNNNTWSMKEIEGWGKVYKKLTPSEY
jgi:hypothetical protein